MNAGKAVNANATFDGVLIVTAPSGGSVRGHPPGVARHHRGLGALGFQWQDAQWTYTPHFARFWTRISLDAT